MAKSVSNKTIVECKLTNAQHIAKQKRKNKEIFIESNPADITLIELVRRVQDFLK